MAINTAPRPGAPADTIPNVRWQSLWNAERIHALVVFSVFILYGTFRAFENNFYDIPKMFEAGKFLSADGTVPHLLSPYYSPPLHHLPFWPAFLSPSLFLLAFPGSFRFSCYFCRRTYYRAIFGTPPSCAAKEVMKRSNYTGEREFPFYLQNLHRYTLYFIMVFVFFHWLHLIEAFNFGNGKFGIGVGTIICAIDTVLLSLYVGSCHSFRHLVGGITNKFSASKRTLFENKVWKNVTKINEKHGWFFWTSLYSVGLYDFYVRLVASNTIQDLHVILIGR